MRSLVCVHFVRMRNVTLLCFGFWVAGCLAVWLSGCLVDVCETWRRRLGGGLVGSRIGFGLTMLVPAGSRAFSKGDPTLAMPLRGPWRCGRTDRFSIPPQEWVPPHLRSGITQYDL